MKSWTQLAALIVAAFKAIRLALFSAEKAAAIEQTEATEGDTSKEEDLLRGRPRS